MFPTLRAFAPLLIVAVSALPCFAQTGPRVAIAAAAANDMADCRYTDLQMRLQQTMRFTAVDLIDVVTQTPGLQQLQEYDAIITWSNVGYYNSSDLGYLFADYVDSGGGVVVAGFANVTNQVGHFLDGRWLTEGYELIKHTAGLQSGIADLGLVVDPNHRLAEGISTVTGTYMARPFLDETWGLNRGRVILEWNDGRMLAVADDFLPQRADLGMHPVHDTCSSGYLESNSDGVDLIANALIYTSGDTIATTYCTAESNSTGSPGRLLVQGTDLVAANDLTLVAAGLPRYSFGVFMCSQMQGLVQNLGGGQGTLCLQGAVGAFRTQVVQSNGSGRCSIQADLAALPTPNGSVAAIVGETWNFQAWYRDMNPHPTSNLTDAASVTFR